MKHRSSLIIFSLIFLNTAWASGKIHFPKKVTDFNVYATNFIDYHRSDFQGIVGAGESIRLSRFSILDLMRNQDGFINPYRYSVITKSFSLRYGAVHMGGVYATDNIEMIDSHRISLLTSKDITVTNAGRSYFYSRAISTKPSFKKYNSELLAIQENLIYKNIDAALDPEVVSDGALRNYYKFEATDYNGTLKNVFVIDQIDRNIVFDANNDSREYFIVFVTGYNQLEIKYKDFKLLRGASQDKILFVFMNASSLVMTRSGATSLSGRDLKVGIPGSILAAKTDILFTNGLLTGSIYSRTLSGGMLGSEFENGGQINNSNFVCFEFFNCKDPNDFPND